jgi:hypothetical protein
LNEEDDMDDNDDDDKKESLLELAKCLLYYLEKGKEAE